MKNYMLFLALGWSLTACEKADSEVKSKAVGTFAFGQDFKLDYQQAAQAPAGSSAEGQASELQITVDDIDFTYCPTVECSGNPTLRCAVGTTVLPTLLVLDAAGNRQQLRLPTNQLRVGNSNWLDTTSVRANGRRYLLHYVKWQLNACNPRKQDFSIFLRVTKPD